MKMSREYHVGKNGCDKWEGSKERPFRTISRAAQMALPGDVITVHQGEYREWVKPANSGRSDVERIVYQAAAGEGSDQGFRAGAELGADRRQCPEGGIAKYNVWRLQSVSGNSRWRLV